MPPLFRRSAFWIVSVCVLVLGAGGVVMASQTHQARRQASGAATAIPPGGPYVAIANGKADVEGGVIQVAARRAGIVRDVLVQEGDAVVRGQALARQEDDEPRLAADSAAADLEQARAQTVLGDLQLSTARREYARMKGLAASNFIAAQRLDQAGDTVRQAEAGLQAQRAAVAAAQARLAEARYNLELTVVRAPVDGRIARRYANPGSGASTLNVSTMFELEPNSRRIVRAELSESALPVVAVAQTVQISPESDPGKAYAGRVLRRAAVFGARKLDSDDPSERADERVVEVVVSADGAPFLIGQRVLVKFLRPRT
ncbi:HlyD family secretion protein [Phenylobacterium sp.]|jgi:HlyD family secretion protein|uniref:HlyD family secretion protein n=1 Tax=Phenylobacterium sp. TaxID=1871053 RepID=UPI002F3E9282